MADNNPAHQIKLTQRNLPRIVRAASLGATKAIQAKVAGVDESTFYRWLQRGRDEPDTIFAELVDALDAAEAAAAERMLAVVTKAAAGGNWLPAAWILERRFGYIKTERQEVQADVRTTTSAMSDEELEALIAEAGGGPTD